MEIGGVRPRHLLRSLWKAPAFTLIAVATIAIGIGANTAAFSVVRGVLLKPLAHPEPERLAGLWLKAPGVKIDRLNAAASIYYLYKEDGRAFESVAMYQSRTATVTGLAEPEQVYALNVTHDVGRVLRVQPQLGRWFSEADDRPKAALTTVISHEYWQQKLGGARDAIGRGLVVNSAPVQVIGVMPAGFRLLDERFALMFPLQLDRAEVTAFGFNYRGIARLKPGVSMAAANADAARLLPMLGTKFRMPPGMTAKVVEEARFAPDLHPLKDDVVGDVGKVLWILMGTLALVLLIASANVTNLLLVRADGRQQDFAVRAALGASQRQLAAALLGESLLLGLLGGVAGVAIAYAGIRFLHYLAPASLPRLSEIALDGPVLAFAFFLSVAAGLLFGLLPAWKHAAPRLGTSLREGGRALSESRDRRRARGTLVVVQVALAVVLVVCSGLMVRTFLALRNVQPGFSRPEEVLTFRVSIPSAAVKDPTQVARMQERIVQALAALPGVQSVSGANSVTMDGAQSNDPVYAEDRTYRDGEIPGIRRYKFALPGFFRTVGNPLLAGRDFTWEDLHSMRDTVILTENLAREFWPSPQAALGKRVRERPGGRWREVIGVVGDELDDGADQPAVKAIYWPALSKDVWDAGPRSTRSLALAIRGTVRSPGFLPSLQRAVWSVSATLPLAEPRTLAEVQRRSMARAEFAMIMLAIAGAMALLLAVVGIYGVISYAVSQRTREIGIRLALGAPPATVRGLFVRYGLTVTGIGLVCGLAAAAGLTRWMASLLYGVAPLDWVTFALAPVALGAAALLASVLPAARASRVDPVVALRAE